MQNKKVTIAVLLAIAICLILAAVVTYRTVTRVQVAESEAGQAFLGGEAPEERFVTVDGRSVDVASYIGKTPMYINAWASWSPLSREELIALNMVAGEFKDKNIVFIALNRKEPRDIAERYLETLPPLDNLVVVIDSQDHFYSQVGGYAMPETLLYDERGDLWRHERQPQTAESIRTFVAEFLAAEN